MSEDNVSEAADDSGHEGSGDRHMIGSREAGLEGSTTQGTSMKDSGCGSGGQESLKALHDQVGVSVNSVRMMLVHVSKYHIQCIFPSLLPFTYPSSLSPPFSRSQDH